MTAAIIEARDLVKRFDGFTAVDHISFVVGSCRSLSCRSRGGINQMAARRGEAGWFFWINHRHQSPPDSPGRGELLRMARIWSSVAVCRVAMFCRYRS
jgi:hypothetical protein